MAIEPLIVGAATWLWGKYKEKLLEKIVDLGLEEAKKGGEKLTESSIERIKSAVKERWRDVKWDHAAQEYCSLIRKDCNTMRVLGMAKPIALESIFTDVFFLEQVTSLQRLPLEYLLKEQDERFNTNRERRRTAMKVVKEHPRLFLLGKPGSGKTTLMKWLVLRCTDGKLDKTPIFITLKEWSDSGEPDLLPFIARQFRIHGFPDAQLFVEALLEEGQAIVLLDGLDEVNLEGGKRDRIIQRVREFASMYRASPFVITCRIAATDYQFADFSYVELADFTEEQAERFACSWFAAKTELANKFLAEMRKDENKDLRELARTPLLLTLLCLNYEETLSFPKRRVEIYEEAIDALLKRWDASRLIQRDEIYRNLSLGRKRQLLCRLAAESFQNGEFFFRKRIAAQRITDFLRTLPGGQDTDDGDGEVVLQAIEAQHGLVITRAVGVCSFLHKTFQEYMTAKHIEKSPLPEVFRGLVSHGHDDGWHEVLIMSASLLETEQADNLFKCWVDAGRTLLGKSKALRDLTCWLEAKAKRADNQQEFEIAALRCWYCSYTVKLATVRVLAVASALKRLPAYLARDFDFDRAEFDFGLHRAIDRDLDLDRDFERAHKRARALAIAMDFTRASALPLDLDLDLDRALNRALDRALDCDLAFVLSRVLAFEGIIGVKMESRVRLDLVGMLFGLMAYWSVIFPQGVGARFLESYFKMIGSFAKTQTPLYDELAKLLPPTNGQPKDWLNFAESFQRILQKHADVAHDFGLSEDDVQKLGEYIPSNRRMLKCLEVASVSNRQNIRNSVFSISQE